MKKFMKTCAILALIMFMLGLGIALGVRAVYGPATFWDFVDIVDDRLELEDDIGGIVSKLDRIDSGIRFDIAEEIGSDASVHTDDTDALFSAELVKHLDVEIGACHLVIEDSEDGDFHIKTENTGLYQGYVSDSTLYIKAIRKSSIGQSNAGTVRLSIPKDFAFGDVDIELGAGLIESNSLIYASEMDIELGAGEILLPYVSVGELDANVGAGLLTMSGDIRGDADVECAMGSVEMNLEGNDKDFNYDIESSAAEINIGGKAYSGLTHKHDIDNHAPKNMSLECAMGNITISFDD